MPTNGGRCVERRTGWDIYCHHPNGRHGLAPPPGAEPAGLCCGRAAMPLEVMAAVLAAVLFMAVVYMLLDYTDRRR